MELGILTDDRNYPKDADYTLELTPLGRELYRALKPLLERLDLSFPRGPDGIPQTRMGASETTYNKAIHHHIETHPAAHEAVFRVFLQMHAAQQMLAFLYHVCRKSVVPRNEIYAQFFQAPFVKQYCDQEGIEEATSEASRRRCPFLLNILDACGIIEAGLHEVMVRKLTLSSSLVRPYTREEKEKSQARLEAVVNAWPSSPSRLTDEDLSIARELFGPTFLTDEYYLKELVAIGG